MSFRAASVLVALTGFIALSLELIWIRVYYFLSATRAYAFAGLLSSYLLGLALGSLWSIRVQRKFENGTTTEKSGSVARLVLWANLAGFLVAPLVSWIAAVRIHLPPESHPWYWSYPLVGIAAAWLGTLLPLICHYAVPPDAKVGSRLSKLYLANIVGSGVGSLLTGFVLMEYIPLRWIGFLLLALGVVIYVVLSGRTRRSLMRGGIALAAGAALTPALYWRFWERMQGDYDWKNGGAFAQIVESRSGVITVDAQHKIYGGGSYDGVMDTSPVRNRWLVRAYALSAMHPNPEDVLIIGLSGGAWAQITAANPAVKRITCVEISHSYTQVIAAHPAVSSLLTNPKVEIVIDDGRRWLERHPERKFDAILMNTTQHYREYASNLLCREFQQLARKHLKPGGVFQYNATGSLRAHQTALETFESVALLLNNVVTWNGPVHWDNARWKSVLENYVIDGQPVFDLTREEDKLTLARMLTLPFSTDREPAELIVDGSFSTIFGDVSELEDFRLRSRKQLEARCKAAAAEAITDDNLGHEYRWWQ